MGKVTHRMLRERKAKRNVDQAETERQNRLWKTRFAAYTHELPPNTYRKNGITLPGKYYGDSKLDNDA